MDFEFPYLHVQFDDADMDGFDDPTEFLPIVSALLIIHLYAHNILSLAFTIPTSTHLLEEFSMDIPEGVQHIDNIHHASIAALHLIQLWNNLLFGDHDLRFWVKTRSITWFSIFGIEEYDNGQ